MGQPKQTPLSYSIPSFGPTDYDNLGPKLQALKGYGFRWITFTPTYEVTEVATPKTRVIKAPKPFPLPGWARAIRQFFTGPPPQDKIINYNLISYTLNVATMPMAKLKAAVDAAVQAGFHVKVEPHLDYKITLAANAETAWRMGMRFHPENANMMAPPYYSTILKPIFDIIQAASALPRPADAGPACFALTLGSELDVSLYDFTRGWTNALDALKQLRSAASLDNPFRLSFGHKTNYDSVTQLDRHAFRMDKARRRTGLYPTRPRYMRSMRTRVIAYLQKLDYCSISFYAPITPVLTSGSFSWTTPPTDADEKAIADEFAKTARGIRSVLGAGVPLDVGEFGLGNISGDGPFEDIPEDFAEKDASGSYKKNERAHNARRKYTRALAKFLASNKAEFAAKPPLCSSYLPLTFWTVKQFDFLGLWDYKIKLQNGDEIDHDLMEDDELKEWVTGYNNDVYTP